MSQIEVKSSWEGNEGSSMHKNKKRSYQGVSRSDFIKIKTLSIKTKDKDTGKMANALVEKVLISLVKYKHYFIIALNGIPLINSYIKHSSPKNVL